MTAGHRGGRRYALLLALWDSEYAKEVYGGYYNVFVAAFGGGEGRKTDERWDCFRVIAGEFPAPEVLASYDGFVVSGSPHDAHGDEPWIRRLCALVQTVHAMRKRVLGICFGHQVLCRALGGRVGRARNGWDVGVRKVTFAPPADLLEGRRLEFLGDLVDELELPRSAALIEVHQDEVWEIPPTATVLAYSEKTRVEVFAVGEHALGIQGHPEYTVDILHDLIDRLTSQKAIRRSVGEEARRTVAETGGPDRAFWTALCKCFLGGGGDRTRPALPAVRETAALEVTSCAVAGCFTGAAAVVQLARSNYQHTLLLALWDSDYARKAYGGYYNVFVAALGGGGAEEGEERWDCFRVIGGEFPAAEDLESYDGFVVSGSPRDAHGDEPWVRRLCALLRTLHAMRKRVLGVCFGHQVLCRALGGRVGRARGGWDVGLRKVTFVQDQVALRLGGLFQFLDADDELPRSASIIEVHQDEVWEIPPTATVLAYSEKTRVEAFAVGEHALGIQGHPEYTVDILHDLIDRLTSQNDIQRSVGEEARQAAAETGGPDRAFWTALCKGFLMGGGRAVDCGGRPAATTTAPPEVAAGRAAASCFTGAAPMVQLACRTRIN